MSGGLNLKSEAKLWLSEIFQNQNFREFDVELTGNLTKGENYIGDIVFAKVSAITENSEKNFDLVLKCSKRSEVAKNSNKFKAPFINETYFYGTLFPILLEFQAAKKIQNPFNFVPKFYGAFKDENQQIIVLEDAKQNGFEVWPRRQPLTKNHLNLVIKAYGKLHATSVALAKENPEKFEKIAEILGENLKGFNNDKTHVFVMFKSCILEVYKLLKDEIEENILEKWKNLTEQVASAFEELPNQEDLRVFLHGDCWSNNFMFKSKCEDKNPSEVIIIDWQLIRAGQFTRDLSYFLFSCISEDDIENLNDFVGGYYKHFCDHLNNFGVGDSKLIYPEEKFWEDWKKNCKLGIILASLLTKICSFEEADVVDLDEERNDNNILGGFANEIQGKGKEIFKNRMRYIVNYVGKNNLI